MMGERANGVSERPNQMTTRFNQKQYEFLRQCSEKGEEGIKEWNRWREEHPCEDILLEGANLRGCWLSGIDWAPLSPSPIPLTEGKKVSFVYLSGAQLQGARLVGANCRLVHFEAASLHRAHLKSANLRYAHLEHSSLSETWLHGTYLDMAHLEGASFAQAMVDGGTSLWRCHVSRETDFSGVGLANARIDPATRQLLEFNERRTNWEHWYKKHALLRWPILIFWLVSDYGRSTGRIVSVFFGLAFAFAALYANLPGAVEYMEVEAHLPLWHYFLLLLLRPVYFSVVTMTTLGFGDMYASAESIAGHVLLTVQVIVGYVLLGALVTRFAVLFTAGGPAGRFGNGKSAPPDG